MDFNDTPQEAAFRQEVRAWLGANASLRNPDSKKARGSLSEEEILKRSHEWQMKKYQSGWACLHWPKEYGGRDAAPMERIIWGQEEGCYDVHVAVFAIGQGMCGPTLMAYASEDHKREYLPPMASGEHIWSQLFSEPSAGSDVAGLQTRAVKDGNEWVINGQKIWTSGAHYSDYGILLTRTDPKVPKHKGLTMFWIDLRVPDVEIRPIRQASGASGFNEVYFTDLRVHDSQRLGEPGQGWEVAITTLMNERLAVGDASGPDFEEIFLLASALEDENGTALVDDSLVRDRLADWYCQQSGLKYTKYRTISALSKGGTPGPENSITKVVSANKLQQIGAFGSDLLDMAGGLVGSDSHDFDEFMGAFMGAPGLRIAGGTDEILRNIIAERVLGLPQDIRVDKGIPFDELN